MPYLTLARTEKAYNLAAKNKYMVTFDELSFQPNKDQVKKILRKHGLTPLAINTLNPYKKIKFRRTRANKVLVSRPKKYFVTLAQGQKIDEDLRLEA
ncbi:MAG: 50S ribosomal protein L23 [Patescibacteria group bacterium]